jgi:hypothetical protein
MIVLFNLLDRYIQRPFKAALRAGKDSRGESSAFKKFSAECAAAMCAQMEMQEFGACKVEVVCHGRLLLLVKSFASSGRKNTFWFQIPSCDCL